MVIKMKKETKEKLSRIRNNSRNKKGLSKAVIVLITAITAIVILVAGIGLLTTMEQLKSENIRLVNENVKLMNKNTELMSKNEELADELTRTRFKLDTTKYDLEKATFELGEDMLTLPKESPKFDCDDSALYMYLYFTNSGYDVRIVAGNLSLENETFSQCDHVWVWVDDGIKGELPYDWGYFDNDEQHSYGYVINYKELLRRAINDQ